MSDRWVPVSDLAIPFRISQDRDDNCETSDRNRRCRDRVYEFRYGDAQVRGGIERVLKGIWRIREGNSEDLEANPQKKVGITYRRVVIRSRTKYIIDFL